ncbi:MAG: Gfo/Idh/MocA family oxidoreductase [Pseudomonadales bacterium]
MSERKLRYGFIGAGGIAGEHMTHLAARDDVELVAMADPDEAAMARHAAKFGVARAFTDWRQMLDQAELDAVSVCTPNRLHAECAIGALEAGCAVLCEKPLAASVAEGERMVEVADRLGGKLVIGFQYRYSPRTQFLRQAAAGGQFGRILYARVQALRRRGIPNWGVFGQKALQGGGPLIDIGVHVLEMAHYTMGSPRPVSASADMFTYLGNKPSDAVEAPWKGWDYRTYDVEDLAVGRIRFEDGAVMHVEASFAAHIEKNFWSFQLMGEQGGATWEPPRIFRDEDGHMVDKSPGWLADERFSGMFKRKMDNFVEHVLHGAATLAPARDGLAVQRMIEALYASAERRGAEVEI